jgi:hypothetical protein
MFFFKSSLSVVQNLIDSSSKGFSHVDIFETLPFLRGVFFMLISFSRLGELRSAAVELF